MQGIGSCVVKKDSVFFRNVVQRKKGEPLDPMHLASFPKDRWLWCFQDASASLKGYRTMCRYTYTAREDFKIIDAISLPDFLSEEYTTDMLVFRSMGNHGTEKKILDALLPIANSDGMFGIKRTIGSGDEYVFFSLNAKFVLDVATDGLYA
jgi:hypothetical protein